MFSILTTLGWICLLLSWVVGYIMSNKEQKQIDTAISNFQETVKTGDSVLMNNMMEEYNKAIKKRISLGGSHSVRITFSIIGLGFLIANLLLYITK
jgi:preprotein translocase subunit YajC